MTGRRWTVPLVLTLAPILAAAWIAELLLTWPPPSLAHNPLVYNPSRFDPFEAAKALRAKGEHVYPMTAEVFDHREIGSALNRTRPVPLSAMSHTPIVLCNETGEDLIITSDEHGFSNPDSVWRLPHADIALVGDSFVHGQCVGPDADIASSLRSRFTVLNIGIAGAGPVAELAALREYAAPRRPSYVFWFFFEGNDMEDLNAEKTRSIRAYLDSGFTQDLILRQDEIDSTMRVALDSTLEHRAPPGRSPAPVDVLLLRRLRTLLGLSFREKAAAAPPDFQTADMILKEAGKLVRSWDGRLVLVYLPDRRRYTGGTTTIAGGYPVETIRSRISRLAKDHGIPVIDMAEVFSSSGEPLSYWTSPRSHYNAKGYALVAREIGGVVVK